MEITATGGGFFISAMRLGGWDSRYNKKDGSLSVWGDPQRPINISTHRGDFLEVLNEKGEIISEGGDGNWFWLSVSKSPVKLRFKTLPDPKLSKAELNKQRNKVIRYLLQDAPYNLGIPGTLNGAIKWMQKKLNEIPEASRAKASFQFDATMKYGETYPQITIDYEEMESDAEVIRRIQLERERARIAEINERRQLDALKVKYKTA